MPTVPPSRKPAASTVSSIPVRTSRSDRPVRRCSPVMSPSRGPGPKAAAMYRPVATPLRTMPAVSRAACGSTPCTPGTTASVASMDSPTANTLETVPSPGRCRSGTHSSSTSAPTATDTVPMLHPVSPASPWWKTSHGSSPSPARTRSAELAP